MRKGHQSAVDIYERIRTGYYTTKLPYPQKSDFEVSEEVETKRLGKQTIRGFDRAGYDAARKAYNEDGGRLYNEFKRDALTDCGITDHPKADQCFALAWEHGHSAGYAEVLSYLHDFSELLKD